MADKLLELESSLFEEVADCERQRPSSWVHYPARVVGRVALMHHLPLPFRTHWNGSRDAYCYGRKNGCEWCERGRGFKGHFCWAVFDMVRKQHGGWDVNDKSVRQVLDVQFRAESRRGGVFTERKEGQIVNGAFVRESSGLMVDPQEFGLPCDIVALVCQTYKIDEADLEPDFVAGVRSSLGTPAPLPKRAGVDARL